MIKFSESANLAFKYNMRRLAEVRFGMIETSPQRVISGSVPTVVLYQGHTPYIRNPELFHFQIREEMRKYPNKENKR